MRGFQPGKARAVPQNYADGGVVSTIKGMLGFGGAKKKPEPLPADLNKMPPTGAGPVASQPEPPKKAISQYSGMSALERRMKEQGLADGGLVRGPGTGISDDIEDEVEEGTFVMPADSTEAIGPEVMDQAGKAVPVNLSNGEAKLPPEALQAIGAQVMEAIKDVTHVPAAKQARGFPMGEHAGPAHDADDGRMNFADGGVVDDKRRPRTVADLARSPGYGAGAGGPVSTPVRPQAPAARPQAAQPVPGVTRQGNSYSAAPVQGPLGSGMYQLDSNAPKPTNIQAQAQRPAAGPAQRPQAPAAPVTRPVAPTPAASATPVRRDRGMPAPDQGRGSMLGEFFRDSVSEVSDKARGGDLAGAFGAATRRTLQTPGMTVAAAATPVLQSAGRMWDGLVGNEPAAAAPAAPAAAAPKPPSTTVVPPVNKAPDPAAPPQKPEVQSPTSTAPGPVEVAPGVFRQGNSFGDSAAAATAGAQPSQGPSARDMQAMNNLIARDPVAGAMDRALGVERDPAQAATGFPQGGARQAPAAAPASAAASSAAPAATTARGFQPASQSAQSGSSPMEMYARQAEAMRGLTEAQRALDQYGPGLSGGGDLAMGGRASQQQFQQDMLRTNLMTQAAKGGRAGAAAMQALNNMEGNQIQLETAQMRERGDTARFNAREQGETMRTGMRESGENARSARRDGLAEELGRGQLDLQRSAQGFTTRQAERQERLYAEYDAAKTPEERAAVARKIAALQGKGDGTGKWKSAVLQGGTDAQGNRTEGVLAAINEDTGEMRRYDQAGGGAQPMPKSKAELKSGQVYETKNGPATWDGKQFVQAS